MKVKIICGVVGGVLILLAGWSGYFYGLDSGQKIGYQDGYQKGSYDSYERGYSLGYGNGKEFVVTHLDQYVTIPKAVTYERVLEFLEGDNVDVNEYTDIYNCISFANELKYNANNDGIKCAIVSFDLEDAYETWGHAINAFETTDRGIVYFDPQTDGERFDIRIGSHYNLSEKYRITKVDIIW